MKELLHNLVNLQSLEFGKPAGKAAALSIAELRGKIPLPVLGHYDRLMARGKKGIVAVHNQVCAGCHMQVPIGLIATLMQERDTQLCGSCGRYLYLPEKPADLPVPIARIKAPKKTRQRKGVLAV